MKRLVLLSVLLGATACQGQPLNMEEESIYQHVSELFSSRSAIAPEWSYDQTRHTGHMAFTFVPVTVKLLPTMFVVESATMAREYTAEYRWITNDGQEEGPLTVEEATSIPNVRDLFVRPVGHATEFEKTIIDP